MLSLQKIAGAEAAAAESLADFPNLRDRWCERVGEAPPPGTKPTDAGLTPEQQTVLTAQLEPENRWGLHPLVDGCQSDEEPPIIK